MNFVGIIGRRICDNKNFSKFNEEIINNIYSHNHYPLCIVVDFDNSPEDEFRKIKPLIDMCSRFIFQGGSDFYEIDKLIINYLYNLDIPVLGICLGMQTIGALFNGEIRYIGNTHSSNCEYVHSVRIDKSSILYKIVGKDSILVNSRHKYCVSNCDLFISAFSDVVEAIEDSSKRFFLGIQWHPESVNDENSYKLFDFFYKI